MQDKEAVVPVGMIWTQRLIVCTMEINGSSTRSYELLGWTSLMLNVDMNMNLRYRLIRFTVETELLAFRSWGLSGRPPWR